MAIEDQMRAAYNAYFANTPVGSTIDFAGGTLRRADPTSAVYTAPQSSGAYQYTLRPDMEFSDIASAAPDIARAWNQQFGYQIPAAAVQAPIVTPIQAPTVTPIQAPIITTQAPTAATQPQPQTDTFSRMKADEAAYWQNNPIGSTFNVAGGTLTRTGENTAIFKNAQGVETPMNRGAAFGVTAQAIPEFAEAWKQQYGYESPLSIIERMNKDAQAYWEQKPIGSTFEVAGGALTRVGDNQAIFTNAEGKQFIMNKQDAFNTIAGRIPEFAKTWKENYGYDPAAVESSMRGELEGSLKNDPAYLLNLLGMNNYQLTDYNGEKYYNDPTTGQMIRLDAIKGMQDLDFYLDKFSPKVESMYGYEAPKREDAWSQQRDAYGNFAVDGEPIRAQDPLFANVDFEPYRQIPHGDFYAIAKQVYGGKNMSMEDIGRINDETGNVGYYTADPNNPGKYMIDPRWEATLPKSAFDKASPFYGEYKQRKDFLANPENKQVADKLTSSFGAGPNETAQLSGILSGFEALGRGDFSEADAKALYGNAQYEQYKNIFGDQIKQGIAGILADKQLTGQEALSAVQTARKYGLDTDELSEITGYDKKLFDAINQSYDSTVNSLVDKSFEGKDLGDQIKTGIALQDQYGLTYEDIAKATDQKPEQVKDLIESVKTFGEKYKEVLSKPDLSGKDILNFVDTYKDKAGVNAIYGNELGDLEKNIDALNEKWGGLDGFQAENIYNQIKNVTNAVGGKNWTGSWSGYGGDSAMKAAVGVLMDKGVDNLSDLAVAPNYKKASASYEFYEGQKVFDGEEGEKYIYKPNATNEGYDVVYLPKDAKTTPGISVDMGDETSYFRPLTTEELKTYDPKTGKFDLAAGNKLIDKSTGKTISTSDSNDFTIHSYDTGNFFKSEDKRFAIRMTDDGVPIPYQTTEKGGFLYSPAFPIMASMLLPGIGSTISGGLASVGGSSLAAGTLANTALTQGIMSGGMAALTGGDVGKSFVGGAIGAPISAGISSLLPTGMDPNLARMATNIGTTAATSALAGKPMNLQGALINAGVQYGAQQLPWNLTPQQVNLLAGVATPYLQGQSISPTQLSGILANYAIKSQMPQKGAR